MRHVLLSLLPWFFSFFFGTIAHAEHINGHVTWVAQDRAGVGMLKYRAGSGSLWVWTTNGNTFDCAITTRDEINHRVEIYCPSIQYTMYVSRYELTIKSPGGSVSYPGNWDDRRYWYYNASWGVGRFELKDKFLWTETQWVNDRVAATYEFTESSRDDDYVYLRDATRNIDVAVGKTQVYVRTAGSTWQVYYNGTW